ncbi:MULTISPECIES: M1 family metallopeptidase [Acidobacteriaceae]|uniref:M1 family metallopeptidase n=1 Tax=Acidobacteriaceae TaxID=204434 RepID=UPI00131ECF01|nr:MULTISPECIES: M1 family metallopeptidase [Acidobacteriaceae]MDW5264768.1 M1 family metallopeptidase [Edaphobacter sp.]
MLTTKNLLPSALLVIASCIAPLAASAQRLPSGVHPEHYTLALTPDLKAATFTGTESIDLNLDQPSTTITLNAAEIKFLSVTVGSQTAQVSLDPDKEQATFTFAQPLLGKVTLDIRYDGILNDKLRGFYLSKTARRNYAVTQFEPTDARRAFPSFDEPALKATFDIALTVDRGDTVISNTNIVSDTPVPDEKHTIKFATTPRMSTYLVAFLVGDFQCTKGSSDGVPIRACSTPDKVKLTQFAVKSAEYILHYYDTYFGIKYPMPKLDMVALPDFEAGAMENFGCITYRETDLLIDSKTAGIPEKKNVAAVVAHEMAHQWFGDMVTMQWWDNIWLNEGFATWMEHKPVAAWHPEWNIPQDEAQELDTTLNYDSQATTRTIRATADTPAQINEMFDGIAYGKAGAVLNMVENYVGEETFRQGVHNYLAAHLYANATAEDFWNAQTATSHLPVDKIMSSFVAQPGVPLLTFSDTSASGIPVAQSRFFLTPTAADQTSQQWTLPVCLKTSGKPACHLLAPGELTLSAAEGSPFFYANGLAKGYFRTAYTAAQYKAIEAKAETALTSTERINFIGDRWALVPSGRSSISDYLNLVLALKQDPNAAVLETALGKIYTIKSKVATGKDLDRLNTALRNQFDPVYAALGKPSKHDSFDQSQLRALLFELLGVANDPAIVAQSREIADRSFGHKRDKNLDPALSDAAVMIAASNGDAAFYDKVFAASKDSSDPGLQSDALQTLARFLDPALVTRTLDYASSGEVRNQDSWRILSILLQQRATRTQAWDYIQKHWDKVHAQFTTNSGVRVVAAAGSFCTAEGRDQVTGFFATHPVDASARTLAKSIDSINACIQFRATQEPSLHQWLEGQPAQ